jgi:ribosomal protein S20
MNKTKKQRNKKLVNQNKRNRILNRRYKNLIKALIKWIETKSLLYSETPADEKDLLKRILIKRNSVLSSVLDKAARKKVYHKNKVARKKSKIQNFLNQCFKK